MHELSITQALFDLVLEQAKAAGAKRVGSINLAIGEMTGIVSDSLGFYLRLLSKDTIAEGATLNVKTINTQGHCRNCDKNFLPKESDRQCPDCGGASWEISGGRELFLESIEVE